jgi:hypothetical protein
MALCSQATGSSYTFPNATSCVCSENCLSCEYLQNTAASACLVCGNNSYLYKGICAASCPSNVIAQGSSTSNRTCVAPTSCPVETFEEYPATSFKGWVCTAVSICNSQSQFEEVSPTITTDRYCASLTICRSTQYQSGTPTSTSDRQCSNATVCLSSEYETQPLTATTDRVCRSFCSTPNNVDLVFVVDSSASLGNQYWNAVQQFAISIIDMVPIMSLETRFGTFLIVLSLRSGIFIEILFMKFIFLIHQGCLRFCWRLCCNSIHIESVSNA